jgi:hypothetical protein
MVVKKYLLIFILLSVLLFIFGCKEKNQNAILKNDKVLVDLICNQQDHANECSDQKFYDLQSFQVFKTALESAEKMPGMINYVAEFNLSITSQDQTTKAFHLSLGANREMKGLLVNLENTNEGYEIPVTHANKLRDLIKG